MEQQTKEEPLRIVDADDTEHAVSQSKLLRNVNHVKEVSLTIANGSTATATHQRELTVLVRKQRISLKTVYFIPSSHLNVISSSHLDEHGISTKIANGQCLFRYKKIFDRYLRSLAFIKNDMIFILPVMETPKSTKTKKDIGTTRRGSSENQSEEKLKKKLKDSGTKGWYM